MSITVRTAILLKICLRYINNRKHFRKENSENSPASDMKFHDNPTIETFAKFACALVLESARIQNAGVFYRTTLETLVLYRQIHFETFNKLVFPNLDTHATDGATAANQ